MEATNVYLIQKYVYICVLSSLNVKRISTLGFYENMFDSFSVLGKEPVYSELP